MRLSVTSCFCLFLFVTGLSADSLGYSVNGVCDGGSCPSSTPLGFGVSETLSMDATVTLANGDLYLIDGSSSGANNGNGTGFSANHSFQITYEGNANGGPSGADTINVELFDSFLAGTGTLLATRTPIGAFGPTIASSSSASTCVDGTLGCVNSLRPPGSFAPTTGGFAVHSSNGAFIWDADFVNNFGAGSPVGSYIVWGQTDPVPPPVNPAPEPAYYSLAGVGLLGVAAWRKRARAI